MLRYLNIQNLAVIESVEVEFQPGFNVLTGETGAGKSILVGAVGLLMGDRASAELVRTGEEQACVQAVFETASGTELIVRREVSTQGRSRAFVDGALVAASALKDLTTSLVELHGQHEHQTLLDPDSHLDLLDAYGQLDAQRAAVASAFANWDRVREELTRLQIDEREKTARLDLLRFQANELRQACVQRGEDDELGTTRRVLANAERLQRLCGEAYSALYEADQAALTQLGHVWRKLVELSATDARFQTYVDMRDGIKGQLEDLAFSLRDFAAGIDASPAKLQGIEDRLALLERLKRKYGPSLDDVIAAREAIERQIEAFEHSEERTASLSAVLLQAADAYLRLARTLSSARRTAAAQFSRALVQNLAQLAMDRTQFEVRFDGAVGDRSDSPESAVNWSARGIDRAECFISPNPGEDLKPLARTASGGELSRIMLAIKSLAAAAVPDKSLIFDEVDAGIGGRVADVVGHKLRALSTSGQVLCITHLPQVAAHGGTHFRIVKEVRHGRTVTRVDRLRDGDRVEELARMLGGAQVTDTARRAAREMLGSAQGAGELKAKGESERAKAKPPSRAR